MAFMVEVKDKRQDGKTLLGWHLFGEGPLFSQRVIGGFRWSQADGAYTFRQFSDTFIVYAF